MKEIKILIADDEPNILMSLEYLMKKAKYKVFIARNGAEAIEVINREIPDIVILDIMMPEVDGYGVCAHIKNTKHLHHIQVIFLSAKSKESDVNHGYDIGADFYITKPFSTRFLMEKIKSLTL